MCAGWMEGNLGLSILSKDGLKHSEVGPKPPKTSEHWTTAPTTEPQLPAKQSWRSSGGFEISTGASTHTLHLTGQKFDVFTTQMMSKCFKMWPFETEEIVCGGSTAGYKPRNVTHRFRVRCVQDAWILLKLDIYKTNSSYRPEPRQISTGTHLEKWMAPCKSSKTA